MLKPISHHDWQVLRAVARGNGKSVRGDKLRMSMKKIYSTGMFLVELVRLRLLEVAKEGAQPFEAKYRLTEGGRFASEYGEYHCDPNTWLALDDQPVQTEEPTAA